MIRINDILDEVSGYLTVSDKVLIQKAYVFSASAHAGQLRLSGEPYLSHPLEVAYILAKMGMDAITICSGLLHDAVEDSAATVEELAEQFGEEVAQVVDGVTKIGKMHFSSKEHAQAENIRKMILAMADDLRVILVKLADRLHNMSTLEFQKEHKQIAIAQETLDIYAPLANRLGLYRVKVQLEDLSLQYSKPDVYRQIKNGIKLHQTSSKEYIDSVCSLIQKILDDNNIKGTVVGRAKHINSIYHKMIQQNLTLDQVYDIIAFRVRVKTVKECYAVFGLIHSLWRPIPGKMKDYIAMPKGNMYQSLHTTVVGPDGERIEIQIRTNDMHKFAEYGVAAHWRYKEAGKLKEKDVEKFSWLRQILDWQEEMKDPREFMQSLRIDLFEDEVYVYTPQGEVKELPEGATPVDFAYLIHTEIGDRCAGAKVNGRIVPLNTPLQHGDTIEIITAKHRHPSRDWLQFVKTAKARTRVRHWIRTEERESSIALAKEILEKEGRKKGINFFKLLKKGELLPVAEKFSLHSSDDLLVAVGDGRITPRQVLHHFNPEEPEVVEAPRPIDKKEKVDPSKKGAIRIDGIGETQEHYAQCCNPVPGDPIIGYMSRGRGVIVHRLDCANVRNMEPERLLEVSWEGDENRPFPVKIRISCRNEKGMLSKIASLLTQEDVNIQSGHFRSEVDGNSKLEFNIEVKNTSHLYLTMERLSQLEHVHEAIRLTSG